MNVLVMIILSLVYCRPFHDEAHSALKQPSPVVYDYEVVNIYPHDPEAFTQGLLFHDGYLYESTGRHGQSSLRKVRLETGEVVRQQDVGTDYFAEGLTVMGDQLYQITLSSGTGFIYDLETFAVNRTFSYSGDGWGLTNDGGRLIMSDGSADLRFLDPGTLRETGRLTVTENGQPVSRLNELELVEDAIFANVLFTDQIVIINPENGFVTGRIDLEGLLSPADRNPPVNVLNGIAYDAETGRLFVTGKLWRKLFEIKLLPRE
ncbi:MAG: glutaminyl-peptide cyclotransferase [Balneolales bacterium]